jgi:hypothetical protein
LIAPEGVLTAINGAYLSDVGRKRLAEINCALPTEFSGADGVLRRTERQTVVHLHERYEDEKGMIYEMGIPICETGDKWHYNVMQKVPMTLDRENVMPGFIKKVREHVFNQMHDLLDAEDMNSALAKVGIESPNVHADAVKSFCDKKFGKQAVIRDLSDEEANRIAVTQGYNVVPGGVLSSAAWSNIKHYEVLKPAGQVTPSPKVWDGEGNPDAKPFTDWIPESHWTVGMMDVAWFAKRLARATFGDIEVRFCASAHHLAAASYGGRILTFNKLRLGNAWFDQGITGHVIALVIHELGHEYGSHLSEDYYEGLCKVGAMAYLEAKGGRL